MKVALKSLGCRLNEAELEHWAAGFQADGHQLTTAVDNADLVVVNTCAVTGEAVKKSRQLIRRSQRRNSRAKLVVSGCYSSLQPGEIKQLPGIDLVIDNSDKGPPGGYRKTEAGRRSHAGDGHGTGRNRPVQTGRA